MLLAEINNNCILDVDLLNLQNIFYYIFLELFSDIDIDFKGARVESIAVARVPSNLADTF